MANKYHKAQRQFINRVHEPDLGAVEWEVLAEKENGFNTFNASLNIWDCGKKVRLEFSVWTEAEARRRADKIDRLINQLQEFKKALGEGYNFIEGKIGITEDE